MSTETLQEAPAAPVAIPRVLHRIWLGDAPLPDEAKAFGEGWARLHPEWELKLWTDADLPPLRNQALFDAVTVPAQRADIARYELLARFGGVYVDTDFECLKALDPLLDGLDAFVGAEDDTYVGNSILGATAGHPFFTALVADLEAEVAARPAAPVNQTTGPMMLTQRIEREAAAGRPVPHVFGAYLFFPYGHEEPHRRHEAFPDAYAVHHWAKSWLPPAVAARFGVQLDWRTPVSMVAVTRAFAATFAPEDPVELAFIVPGRAAPEHVEQVRMVLDAVAGAPGAHAAAAVYGEDELAVLPLDAAVTHPPTDVHAGVELAETIAHMQRVHAALHPAPAPAAVPVAAGGGVHGTYVGRNRMLVSTTWGGHVYTAADDRSLTPYLVAEGTYDVPFTAFLQRALQPGDVVVDVGANVGLFTVLMALRVGSAGHVLAYEAAPANATLLRENLAANWVTDRVTVVEAAAAEAAGTASFALLPEMAMLNSLEATHDDDAGTAERIDVPLEPLDDRLLDLPRVALVKVDVEGAEHRVLAGMRRALDAGIVRRLSLEVRRDASSPDAYERLAVELRRLGAAGWRAATLDEQGACHPVDLEAAIALGTLPQLLLER